MKKVLLSVLISLISLSTHSTHTLGADIRVEQISANQFKVIARYVNSTGSGVVDNGKVFDNVTNALVTSFIFSKDSSRKHIIRTIPVDSVFVVYVSGIVTLANNPNGYYINTTNAFTRSPSTNIIRASMILTCQIPNPAIAGGNSNPKFINYHDSLFLCVNRLSNLDYSCIDPDGDSLVYSLITPIMSASTIGSKPFTLANWNSGFNLTNILGAGATCRINPATGIVTGRSAQLGLYTITVKCEEFRGGIKIGETMRDIPVPSFNCIFTGIEESDLQNSISIFPNPSNGVFSVNISNNKTVNFEVFSMKGQKVYSTSLRKAKNKMNLSHLNKGVYFVSILDENQKITKKIIIE